MAKEIKRLNTEQVYKMELAIAKQLNIDVKNIKYFKGHDGMQGINADLYYEGKKFATAYDDARGGEMDVRPISYDTPILAIYKEVEDKLRALPKYILHYDKDRNGKPVGGKMSTWESSTDMADLVDAIARQKQELKEHVKGILYTTKEGEFYAHWNMSLPAMMKKHPKTALPTIQKRYDELSSKYPITNKDYLASIGVQVNALV